MLESHNDSAAAIAEHVGGSVEGFSKLMNQKAKDIGCYDTFFITPNGLDATATDKDGNTKVHSTTARDLARIMKYCINESEKREEFLMITRTQNYSFLDADEKRNYNCNNHNAFLSMMDGALSGKTGFTNNAGYCYVGALKRGDRTFIVALLACGWPNNRSYKWSDTRKLMSYGLENYEYKNVFEPVEFKPLYVERGIPESNKPYDKAYTAIELEGGNQKELDLLLKNDEKVTMKVEVNKNLMAPIEKNKVVGYVKYYLENDLIKEYPILTQNDILCIDFTWIFRYICKLYAL